MIKTILLKAGHGLLTGGLFLLMATACNNSEEVGLNLTSINERFRYRIDSSAVITATTLRQDSLTSEKRTASLLGCMNDPVFGRSTAHLLTQLRLSSNDVDFGESPVLDSAMFLLKYQSWYGDTTTRQDVRIYELSKDLYYDSTYYSNMDINGFYDPASPIATFSYQPFPSQDSVLIRLSDSFGQKILEVDTSCLTDNTAWLTFFRGLYLEAQPVEQGGSIISYNFSGGSSRITLYYHNSENDSLSYEVIINTNCTWVNLFNHDYSKSSIEPLINDSLYDHPEVYLQCMSGTRAYLNITLPDTIQSLVNSGVAVNRAELVFTLADDPTSSSFTAPSSLRVFNARTDLTNEYIEDLALGDEYYGGTLDSTSGTYSFNIGRHIQTVIHPDTAQRIDNNGLLLVLSDERISAGRLILKNGPRAMKLIITYTPIN
ncbi:MAG: DUF4270 family protein [Bacteroidota bacterium]